MLLSGPFIDLNRGSAERLVQRATRQRFEACHELAQAVAAREMIFLSSYLPLINLPFYDKGWLAQSVAFWRAYLDAISSDIMVSLCNTFEYRPDLMVRVLEEVNRPNFQLSFDLGHFLVDGRAPLASGCAKQGGSGRTCKYTATTAAWIRTMNPGGECSGASRCAKLVRLLNRAQR